MLVKDITRDKIKFTYVHTYKELAFKFFYFLLTFFQCMLCVCVYVITQYNVIQQNWEHNI